MASQHLAVGAGVDGREALSRLVAERSPVRLARGILGPALGAGVAVLCACCQDLSVGGLLWGVCAATETRHLDRLGQLAGKELVGCCGVCVFYSQCCAVMKALFVWAVR